MQAISWSAAASKAAEMGSVLAPFRIGEFSLGATTSAVRLAGRPCHQTKGSNASECRGRVGPGCSESRACSLDLDLLTLVRRIGCVVAFITPKRWLCSPIGGSPLAAPKGKTG